MVSASQAGLDQYLWKNRLLLIFAPGERDPRLAKQLADMSRSKCGIRDRDIRIFRLVKDQPAVSADGREQDLDQVALRKAYGIRGGDFAAILIGKDGGEKMRAFRPLPTNNLFEEVDAMPMRQDEIRTRLNDCS
ncbi:MAG: DUF4174 domain-containing protein [Rhodospirillales bacterium]